MATESGFGDACVWWVLCAIACHTWWGAATVLSSVVLTLLLARGTGKPLLEKDIRERWHDYADYVERTSGFFPCRPDQSGSHPAANHLCEHGTETMVVGRPSGRTRRRQRARYR